MDQVSRMHREIFASHMRISKTFGASPMAPEARKVSLWADSYLADTDGLKISKDLLKNFVDLETHSREADLAANCRAYVARRALAAQKAAQGVEQANAQDAAPGDIIIRNAVLPIYVEDEAISRKCLARIDALK